jgi:hypothetical protein
VIGSSEKTAAMKLAIMQPYFFPYLGYFQLIHAVDRFILFDDVQYIRHGWINRNRILKPVTDHQYILLATADHHRDTLIKDVQAKGGYEWKEKILRQVEHYKKRSPYYTQVLQLLQACFENNDTNITMLNGHYLKMVCDYIGIDFKIEISSAMSFDYSQVQDAGEWALKISEQLGADEYINPQGGVALFDPAKFEQSKIKLSFASPVLEEYSQRRPVFEAGLSIIDILMFNTPEQVRAMLNNYKIS